MSWTNITNGVLTQTPVLVSPFDYETYVGHSGNTTLDYSIGFNKGENYRCAVVANRRMFVANVKRLDKNGVARVYEDRVMYSPANKLDMFPATNYIDLGFNDGQAITALQAYGDRLFVFKDKALYVVYIGGAVDTQWRLEGSYNNYGVAQPCNVIGIDVGIVWVNANGLFIFDGNTITNTIDDKIDAATWLGFTQDDSIVSYYQPSRKVAVIKRAANAVGHDDAYVYNLRTRSFSYIDGATLNGGAKSNAVQDVLGNSYILTVLASATPLSNLFNVRDL